jgi:monomeric isocitrate dehydrogenase
MTQKTAARTQATMTIGMISIIAAGLIALSIPGDIVQASGASMMTPSGEIYHRYARDRTAEAAPSVPYETTARVNKRVIIRCRRICFSWVMTTSL